MQVFNLQASSWNRGSQGEFCINVGVFFVPLSRTLKRFKAWAPLGKLQPHQCHLNLRIHELVPHSTEQQRVTWSHATTSFALFQAAAAYGFSWIFAQTGGDYLVLFGLGGAAAVLALAIDLVLALNKRKA